jgi:peptidoglycan hydrolase-like protein with peptidoglycan-binding domain
VAAAAGLLVGGLIAVAVLADRVTPVPIAAADPTPVVLPVTDNTVNQATTVPLKAIFDAPGQVVSRGSGVLTQLLVAPGSAVPDGKKVARVDGRPIVAMVAPKALYRSIGRGDRGPDVRQLQVWLAARGFSKAAPDGRVGSATQRAIKAWERSLGVKPTGTFDLGLVAWVGPQKAVVAELQTSAGRNVAAGDVLFTTQPSLRAITVDEPAGGITQDGAQVVDVGGVQVPYTLGSGRITDRKDVARLRAAFGTATEGIGRVVSSTAQRVKIVPASAIVTSADGRTCVFASVDAAPTAVTPLGGGLGGVTVPADLPLTTVLANPAEVRPELTCG